MSHEKTRILKEKCWLNKSLTSRIKNISLQNLLRTGHYKLIVTFFSNPKISIPALVATRKIPTRIQL